MVMNCTFPVLFTTQNSIQYNPQSPSHTYINKALIYHSIFSITQHSYVVGTADGGNFGVQYLNHGHLEMQTEDAEDRTTEHLVNGRH